MTAEMTTYVLIHGAGDVGSAWDLVAAELRARGHDVVAVDLPSDDESAGWTDYADTVVEALGDRSGEVVVVGHSLGGFTAPMVCARVKADLLVLVAAMIPAPGETAEDWWAGSGYQEAAAEAAASGQADHDGSDIAVFYQDVEPELAAEALAQGRDQAAKPMRQPWPLDAWPDVPTRYILCRDDRVFPAGFARRLARERLGITADEIDGGHAPYLSRPKELVEMLEAYRVRVGG